MSIRVVVMVVGVLGWSPVVSGVAPWQQTHPNAEVAPSPHSISKAISGVILLTIVQVVEKVQATAKPYTDAAAQKAQELVQKIEVSLRTRFYTER